MKPLLRLLPLLLLASTLTCWAQPAQAARLASLNGTADETRDCQSTEFRLSDQTTVEIAYRISDRGDNCSAQVRIYREHNGRWLVINTVLDADTNTRGSRSLTLPAGNYKIEVCVINAGYDVTVDKP